MTRLLTVIHKSKLANETDLEMHIRDALANDTRFGDCSWQKIFKKIEGDIIDLSGQKKSTTFKILP